jgi:hypothetical protein
MNNNEPTLFGLNGRLVGVSGYGLFGKNAGLARAVLYIVILPELSSTITLAVAKICK